MFIKAYNKLCLFSGLASILAITSHYPGIRIQSASNPLFVNPTGQSHSPGFSLFPAQAIHSIGKVVDNSAHL